MLGRHNLELGGEREGERERNPIGCCISSRLPLAISFPGPEPAVLLPISR